MSEESPSKNKGIDKKFFKLSTTSSLPLVLNDVCVLRSEPGMDILPRSSALGQYHNPHLPHNIHNFHHHTDQTKSLQELQNEVGALLEFRDLVIETFPDLKHKMASSGANSTITGIPTLSSIVSRREWEPGIRVRRKLNNNQKEGSNSSSGGGSAGEIIQSTSLLTRSRSNSHSGKKELKSGEGGNVSVVQDSGFSSSSKDAHSATSNNNNNSSTLSGRLGSTENSASENELWNLLDVIQRRTARVSDEIGHYHEFEKKKRIEKSPSVVLQDPQEPITFHTNLYNLSKESVRLLQKERDNMMDKMGDLEAECHYRRIKESNFQQQLDEMQQTKFNLEQQVKSTTSRNHIIPILPELPRKLETNPSKHQMKSTELLPSSFQGPSTSNVKPLKNELGHLDFLFSPSPNSKINKVRQPDSKKIAAILLETNVIELQRHLLTITVHNQVLQQRLENSTRSKNYLIKQLDKSKDDIDDLKFQIQERNIELEGTLAQLRVIETKQGIRSESTNAEHLSALAGSLMQLPNNSLQQQNGNVLQQQTTISTPSMKAMVPLAMDEIFQHSSSTESATHFDDQHDHDIVMTKYPETPKRSKPSKIPLPGSKGYIAKPPTGRNCANPGPPSNSNRSLTKSTGSLFVKYTESSATSTPKPIKDTSITVANDTSVHSWRNLSFDGKSRSSSIPISKPVLLNVTLSPGKSPSTSSSPNTNKYVASSYRRDSLKLTRLQSASTTTLNPMRSASTSNNNAGIGSNNSNSNRKSTALPVRRLSHNSNNDISDLPADQNVNTNETNGAKVLRIWNFDQSDKTKDEATEFVIDLKQSTEECSVKINNTELQRNFSYKISNIPVGDL